MAHRRFHRVRHHAGRAAAGWKGSLMGLGAGAVVSFGTSFATSRIDFLKASQNWWATPTALAVLGHFLKNRNPALGYAILGIAGAVGVENFTKTPTNAMGFGAGLGDAGLLFNANQGTDASPGTNAAQNVTQGATGFTVGLGDTGDAGAVFGYPGAMGYDDAMTIES